jgi:hypothetical protein
MYALPFVGLRVEWAKLRARSQRWNEEVQIIEEEKRRFGVSAEYYAVRWEGLACVRQTVSNELCEGLQAYAHRQAHLRRMQALRATVLWSQPVKVKGASQKRKFDNDDDDNEDDDEYPIPAFDVDT